jgi:hypothetical protein
MAEGSSSARDNSAVDLGYIPDMHIYEAGGKSDIPTIGIR